MRKVTTKVYKYDELSDAAKEKAREWYRECVFTESHDWEFVFDDAIKIGELFGLTISAERRFKTVGGRTHTEPAIYFTGFSSQGDGACFEGRYKYKPEALAAVKEYAPQDEKLHSIIADIQASQEKIKAAYGFTLTADCKHRGHYYHSGYMDVSFDATDYPNPGIDADETMQAEHSVKDGLRAFADWIYARLQEEYEYQSSDEAVEDSIRANEYEFTADGARF